VYVKNIDWHAQDADVLAAFEVCTLPLQSPYTLHSSPYTPHPTLDLNP
jgi:hypothetical protein